MLFSINYQSLKIHFHLMYKYFQSCQIKKLDWSITIDFVNKSFYFQLFKNN
jgi:hypothetical protein